MPSLLAQDHVYLWLADLADPDSPDHDPATRDPTALEPLLSAAERRRAARFHHPSDRHRYVLRHGLLRTLLARYLGRDAAGIEIVTAPAGKPSLALDSSDAWLRFNLSSSRDLCLFAFAHTRDVGVDIQAIDPGFDIEPLLPQLLTPGEAAWWRNVPAADRTAAFHRLWARKEACVKCTGEGATVDLTLIETGLGQPSLGNNPPTKPAPLIAIDLNAPPGYAAALAAPGPTPQLVYSRI